jgi:hypothetical protein
VLVAILRAGLGLVDGFLRLVPDARVGHLGMYRDEEALRPVGYYENIPPGVAEAEVFVVGAERLHDQLYRTMIQMKAPTIRQHRCLRACHVGCSRRSC